MKKPLALLTVLPFVLLLAACGGSDEAGDGKTSVVASFYPLQFVVEQVGGDFIDVDNLTALGGDAHELELKPQQVAELQEADVVVFERTFQPAVDEAVDQADRSAGTTVDFADLVPLAKSGGEGEFEEFDGFDPHVWQDPANMITITDAVAAALSKADPDHRSAYEKNAEKLTGELETLDTEYADGLADCALTSIVTSHDAFGYLTQKYGLTQIPIAGLDPTNEPSSGQLADITELVETEGITTIFNEELVSPAISETVARETGATTATLDTIEGLTDDTADETYLTLMRNNLAALKKANDCP